jgi:pantoate--beta-alanine ligase
MAARRGAREGAPAVARDVAALRQALGPWRERKESIALVPTMGALHPGHVALMARAREVARRVVVSLFVNPLQFAPSEDFARYPRDEAADLAALTREGIDLVFAPNEGAMFSPGFATRVHVSGLSETLCGPERPGHFDGVATVVTKLLLQCLPDVAVFGEKDYQQLLIVKRLVRDLDIPCAIEGVPTVRDRDGLAFSSRNVFLTAEQRVAAAALPRVLQQGAARLADGAEPATPVIAQGIDELKSAGFARVDYLTLCDAETLVPLARAERPARLLAAARIGQVRLIDNVPVRS